MGQSVPPIPILSHQWILTACLILFWRHIAATSFGGLPICVWNAAPGCWPKHDRSSSGVVVCRGLTDGQAALQKVNLELRDVWNMKQ